jgi:hypothetical protein
MSIVKHETISFSNVRGFFVVLIISCVGENGEAYTATERCIWGNLNGFWTVRVEHKRLRSRSFVLGLWLRVMILDHHKAMPVLIIFFLGFISGRCRAIVQNDQLECVIIVC